MYIRQIFASAPLDPGAFSALPRAQSHNNRHMSAVTLNVNGRTHRLDLDPATPLLYALSDDLELHGPKFGCGLGQCGACVALVNGAAVRTCITPVSAAEGKEIMTL